jgi:hypothetical protein
LVFADYRPGIKPAECRYRSAFNQAVEFTLVYKADLPVTIDNLYQHRLLRLIKQELFYSKNAGRDLFDF